MFKSVGSLIKEVPSRSKSPSPIIALQVRQVAKEVIKQECRDLSLDVVDTIKPTSFKAGILIIKVNSSLVAGELKMRSGGLIEQINRSLGKKLVRDLRFRLT